MAQYIDKAAVVAEIERRKHKLLDNIICESDKEWVVRTAHQLNRIIMFLDTLEVKEADLEKHLKEDIEDVFFDLNGVAVKGATHYLSVEDVKDIAKHFFDLGLSVSNKAQKGE